MTLSEFYKVLIDFVRYYPKADQKCDRMQSFVVLDNFKQLNTANLGRTIRDRGKEFFWSREWHAAKYSPSRLSYSYPLLMSYLKYGEIQNPFADKQTKGYFIDLLIVDKYYKDKQDRSSGCEARTKGQIGIVTETFIEKLISYLGNIVYVVNSTDDGWYNREIYSNLNIGGNVDETISRRFKKELERSNEKLTTVPYHGGNDDLHGTLITINLSLTSCASYVFDPTILAASNYSADLGCVD